MFQVECWKYLSLLSLSVAAFIGSQMFQFGKFVKRMIQQVKRLFDTSKDNKLRTDKLRKSSEFN